MGIAARGLHLPYCITARTSRTTALNQRDPPQGIQQRRNATQTWVVGVPGSHHKQGEALMGNQELKVAQAGVT